MKSKISAMMDGELDPGELKEPLAALGSDAEARESWRTYPLISDALRGDAILSADCTRRVSRRLANEPVLIAPLPGQVRAPVRPRWFVPSALAASIAAIAFVGWVALARLVLGPYGLARNLVQSNYQGAVHFVNQRGGSLFGHPLHPSLEAASDPLDLAFLLVPAGAIPEILHQAGRRGLKAVVVGSGGFRETGPQGAALESQILQIARSYGIRLIGPNCIGLLDTHLPIDATFLPPPGPPPGDVAFISHSGAICAAVIDWARGQGFGMSRLVSLGQPGRCQRNGCPVGCSRRPFHACLDPLPGGRQRA